MKYQQLENLESGWKWSYLVKKYRNGEEVTRHVDRYIAEEAVAELLKLEDCPTKIQLWIKSHLNSQLEKKLQQTIRARRKRHFNAEDPATRKKSIDLEFAVWQRLANYARQLGLTLSEAVELLIKDASHKTQYASRIRQVKEDLALLLKNSPKSPL